MRIMRSARSTDPLEGHVEVDVSLTYDLLEALSQLVHPHDPDMANTTWAMRVRERLSLETRTTLDDIGYLFNFNMGKGPQSRTIEAFFARVEAMPAETFVDDLQESCYEGLRLILAKIRSGETLTPADRKTLVDKVGDKNIVARILKSAPLLNDQPVIKARMLAVLHDFYESYFKHESERIWPILEESANRARAGIESGLLPTRQIIENLTNGLTLAEDVHYKRVVLAPSFYNAPYVNMTDLPNDGILILYPARPEGMQIDGERVDNERLLRRLKALADKTRLDIVQLLAKRPHYTQELADALHLTQPTIWHHMRDLRVAGLVRVEEGDNAKRYSLRTEFVESLTNDLYMIFGLGDQE